MLVRRVVWRLWINRQQKVLTMPPKSTVPARAVLPTQSQMLPWQYNSPLQTQVRRRHSEVLSIRLLSAVIFLLPLLLLLRRRRLRLHVPH